MAEQLKHAGQCPEKLNGSVCFMCELLRAIERVKARRELAVRG